MPPSTPQSRQLLTLTLTRARTPTLTISRDRGSSRDTPTLTRHSTRPIHTTPPLSANLIRRPHRPYAFTQLITLSDGSTFVQRTTSPISVYRSSKDARNTPLWNPSNARMASVEEDEAGRLRAFRRRFGRGWDAESGGGLMEGEEEGGEMGEGEEKITVVDGVGARVEGEGEVSGVVGGRKESNEEARSGSAWSDEAEENLMDLIGSYGREAAGSSGNMGSTKPGKPAGKGKRGGGKK